MSSSKSKVSVVIPCYNHADFLPETLTSVLNSSYANIEVIVVNDGSSDKSEEVAMFFAKKYKQVKYLAQKNQGPAASRNNGIKMAKGNYILPLDADDLISEDYIEKAVDVLDLREEIKLVYCKASFFGEREGAWKLPEFSRKYLARENMIFSTAMYRKADWEKVGGYDERMTWGWEDWEFWISLLKDEGEVLSLPINGFFYRVRKGSRRKSTNKDAKRKTIALINEKHKDFVYEYLNGPLRYNRSWSVLINRFLPK